MALPLPLLIQSFPQSLDRIFMQPGGVEQTQYDQLRRTLWPHAVVPPKSKTFSCLISTRVELRGR